MFRLLVDDTLALVMLEPHHAPILFHLVDDNRDHLRRWLSWVDFQKSPEDSEKFLKQRQKSFVNSGELALGILAIKPQNPAGEIVGTIGTHIANPPLQQVEIGYWISTHAQGKGYVTKACKAMCELLFETYNHHRIVIHCAVGNEKSSAVANRLGFQHEGILRQAGHVCGATPNDPKVAVDFNAYSLLKSDYLALKKEGGLFA